MAWLEEFAKFARGQIGEEIVESLNARGVSDEQIDTFCVGYVNGELPALELPEDFRRWSHNGAKLRHMYCFPLTNPIGEIRGFQFRPVDRSVRGYQDFILESGEPVLFGLAQAMPHIWSTGLALPVEGPFDLFPLQRHVPWSFATMGAHISEALGRTLLRTCKKVFIGFDNDSTGRRESNKFCREYRTRLSIEELKYPKVQTPSGKESKDPGDLWETWGDQGLRDRFVDRYVYKKMEKLHG